MIGCIAVIRDITELKQNEEALERLLSQQNATLEATADGILVTDRNERVLGFNQRFLEIWKIPAAAVEGKNYHEALNFVLPLLSNAEECTSRLEQIFAHPEADSFDVIRLKSGTVPRRFTRPQRLAGEVVGRVFSYRDVTAQVQAEAGLRESEARKRAVLDSALDSIIGMKPMALSAQYRLHPRNREIRIAQKSGSCRQGGKYPRDARSSERFPGLRPSVK